MTHPKENSPWTNRLIHASSPYLKQHAHNPVDWYEWGPEALEKARTEGKPILVSIGYSACHWCHVMAHEVFENDEVAARMNEWFVNIKIDREERPDLDQVYMDALQVMTGRGGWPLNVFALPDGRPFWGGTYFPAKEWGSVIHQLHDLWENKPETVYEYASRLTEGIRQSQISEDRPGNWDEGDFHESILQFKAHWDVHWGGLNRAPKFPMPVLYKFALMYFHLYHDPEVLDWVVFSIKRMSLGGMYDTVGGGFARYSVDHKWHVPHFEKMLYDNAQLLSLMAEVLMVSGDPFFEKKIEETHAFLLRELHDSHGGLYSALDADSEGEEGKYYCFTWDELEQTGLLTEHIIRYYHLSREGNWEHGKNIVFAIYTPEHFASAHEVDQQVFSAELSQFLNALAIIREQRVRPGLDHKVLTSWNALCATGLLKCYKATGNNEYLKTALEVLEFLKGTMRKGETIYRNFNQGKVTIPGFLEDYVFMAEALTEAYQLTKQVSYLLEAKTILDQVISEFSEGEGPFFLFNPDPSKELYFAKTDLGDDVIPSANSVLCELLIKHSFYFSEPRFYQRAEAMLSAIHEKVNKGPIWYANWLCAAMLMHNGVNQLTVCGINYPVLLHHYLPNTIVAWPDRKIPMTSSKMEVPDGLYLCRDFECYAPETDLSDIESRLF